MIFNCTNPACRQSIEADDSLAGERVACPTCATMLQIPPPPAPPIRFRCHNPDCGQNIMADATEAGRSMRCPVCNQRQRIPGPRRRSPTITLPRWRDFLHVPVTPWKRLAWGWSIGACLLALLAVGFTVHSEARLPERMDQMADEVFYEGGILTAPTEDQRGNLFYFQEAYGDVEAMRLNLASLKASSIRRMPGMSRNTEFRWLGWSPDCRHLAYLIKVGKQYELNVCDGYTGGQIEKFEAGIILEHAWLSDNTVAIVLAESVAKLYVLNLKADPRLGQFGARGLVRVRSLPDESGIVTDSNHSVCYFESNALWHFDLAINEARLLARPGGYRQGDLRFSPENGKYLFVTYEGRSSESGPVWAFDPASVGNSRLVQITTNNARRPDWILGGAGVAFIENNGGREQITLKTDAGGSHTIPLSGSEILGYTVGSQGNTILATAKDERELRRIWQYDISPRSLKKVHSDRIDPPARRVAATVQGIVTNVLGKPVDYYLLPPVDLKPDKKYPVLIDTFSAHRAEDVGQFFANSGIYYVSPGLFGETRLWKVPEYEDVVRVYELLLKDPNVDPQRIYLAGQSISTWLTSHLVDDHPDWWRGLLVMGPSAWPNKLLFSINPAPMAGRFYRQADNTPLPSLFISFGEREDSDVKVMAERILEERSRRLAPARIDYQSNSQHAYRIGTKSKACKAMAKFILTEY